MRSSWPITNSTIINVTSTGSLALSSCLSSSSLTVFDCSSSSSQVVTLSHEDDRSVQVFNLISWQMVPSSSEWIVSLWKDAFNALLFRNGHVDLCSTLSQPDPRCAHAQELHQGWHQHHLRSLWHLRYHQNHGDFPRHSWPPLWESLTSPSVPAILSFRSPQTQPQWTCKRWRRFFHRLNKDYNTAGGSSDSLGGKPYGSSAWHRRRK